MNTSVGTLKPNIDTIQLKANATIEATNKYVSAATIMVVMDHYQAKAIMRNNATLFLNVLILLLTQQLHLNL